MPTKKATKTKTAKNTTEEKTAETTAETKNDLTKNYSVDGEKPKTYKIS